MTTQAEERSRLERFFDSFLQESNIKWLLCVGVMILLGSSLMLVTEHWGQMPPFWKCGLLIGYTSFAFVCGEFSYRRLRLRTTGTVLMSLTLLLIPLVYFGMHRIGAGSFTTVNASTIGFAILLVGHTIFSFVAGRKIFAHFLRESQPSLLACYLVLSAAGAIVPSIVPTFGPIAAIPTALILWLVFSIGVVKGSREVFWLTESQRLPRVFGFFPSLLLGMQFAALFAIGCANHIALDWLGLCAIMLAIPIFKVADTVADVFQQRTGNLVRPLPASIVIPIAGGLALCAAGLALATTALPGHPYALVPTAALGAVVLFLAAKRTGHTGFVWAMLTCVLIAYRFCPIYAHAFVQALKQSAASVIREDKLPMAFYGLTCLPLILITATISRRLTRAGEQLFSRPLAQFGIGLSGILFFLSFTNAKASFAVPAVMVFGFSYLARSLNDRRLLLGTLLALIVSAARLLPFCELMLGESLPFISLWFNLAMVALVLMLSAKWADSHKLPVPGRFLHGVFIRPSGSPVPVFDQVARWLLTGVAVAWTLQYVSLFLLQNHEFHTGQIPFDVLPPLTILAILLTRTLWRLEKGMGEITVAFAGIGGLLTLAGMGFDVFNGSLIFVLTALSAVACRCFNNQQRVSIALGKPLGNVCDIALLLSLAVRLPTMFSLTFRTTQTAPVLWVSAFVLSGWAFASAIRWKRSAFGYAGFCMVLLTASAACSAFFFPSFSQAVKFTPVVWSSVALLGLLMTAWLDRNSKNRAEFGNCIARPVNHIASVVLVVTGILPVVLFGASFQIAGLISLAGLFVAQRINKTNLPLLSLANLQLLSAITYFCAPVRTLMAVPGHLASQESCLLAALSAISVVVFHLPQLALLNGGSNSTRIHQVLLRGGIALALLGSFSHSLTVGGGVLAAVAFLFLAVDQIVQAVRKGQETFVWFAEGTLLTGFLFVVVRGAFDLNATFVLYGILSAGLLARAAAAWFSSLAKTNNNWRVAVRPMRLTSWCLPALTVPFAIAMRIGGLESWLGANSLPLLIAAGFYFWQGLESGQRKLLVLSVAIVNVEIGLLLNELRFSDPQFFLIPIGVSIIGLVEILKREIPRGLRNPLRYLGALAILVSPTFHMVTGSWVHIVTLMLFCVLMIVVAIGLRTRALVYTGTAFLLADLIAMVVWGADTHPNLPWIVGLLLGGSVIALAAVAEGHRERMLARIRLLSAELQAWD